MTPNPPRRALRMLLVDDHAMFRESMRDVLRREFPTAEIVEAEGVDQARALAPTLRPNAAIVDILLDDGSGIDVIRQLHADPGCCVLAISGYRDEETQRQALQAGASAFLPKSLPIRELIAQLRALVPIADDRTGSSGATAGGDDSPLAPLTRRERRVLKMLVAGAHNDQIAAELGISRRTVETHRCRLLRKLGLHSLAELILFAVRQGLLTGTGAVQERRNTNTQSAA